MIEQLTQLDSPVTHDGFKPKTDDPIVLCAADDHYVQPLAVMLTSAADSLRAGGHLYVFLLDGGISETSWSGLRESLSGLPISVQILKPDRSEIEGFSISHHITHTAYFRLLAARLLPNSIEKIIYLDCDVLVRRDLTDLWHFNVGDHYCLAAIDIACPFVDARLADKRFKRSLPYLAAISPIPNWQSLGLDGSAPYFNSGVMVLNLKRWREEQIELRLLECLRQNAAHVWCWDQYALNVVFAGQWAPLPACWNQGAHVFEYPDEHCSPLPIEQFRQMRDDPALIHFTTEFKPWSYHSRHPLRATYFSGLDQTAWQGWRPSKPAFSLQRLWTTAAVRIVRECSIRYRQLAGLLS